MPASLILGTGRDPDPQEWGGEWDLDTQVCPPYLHTHTHTHTHKRYKKWNKILISFSSSQLLLNFRHENLTLHFSVCFKSRIRSNAEHEGIIWANSKSVLSSNTPICRKPYITIVYSSVGTPTGAWAHSSLTDAEFTAQLMQDTEATIHGLPVVSLQETLLFLTVPKLFLSILRRKYQIFLGPVILKRQNGPAIANFSHSFQQRMGASCSNL